MKESAKKIKTKSSWTKKIIHIDMDAFFAAIEQRDHPEYRGKPVIVGGNPAGRGVVSTASYEARKFGIHSAMPAAQARKLCPQAVFLRPNFDKYHEASDTVMAILKQHTNKIEPVSLDEGYLDVTENKLDIEDPIMITAMIKQSIFAVTRLTASAGVAQNLFLAKVASDMNKPDGLTVIRPHDVKKFLETLPVRKIPGVGPVTEKVLKQYGLRLCGDLTKAGASFLYDRLGKTGLMLHERALGIDEREVEPGAESKQYSVEETFGDDTRDWQKMEMKINEFAREIFLALKEKKRTGRTVVLKVKYYDFELITRSKTLTHDPKSEVEIFQVARKLLRTKTLAGRKSIRLLGLGLSSLKPVNETVPRQWDFFDSAVGIAEKGR